MELEGGSGSSGGQGVTGGDGGVQGRERGIEAAVVPLVRLGHQGRNRFDGGEDGELFPRGVPDQHFIKEPESLQRRLEPRGATGDAERGGVDELNVLSERVVDWRDRIERSDHEGSPCSRHVIAGERWPRSCFLFFQRRPCALREPTRHPGLV